jgi:hypothetical protein
MWSRIDGKQSNGSLSRSSLKGKSTWGGLDSMNGNGVQKIWVVLIMLVKHLGYEVKWENKFKWHIWRTFTWNIIYVLKIFVGVRDFHVFSRE